MAKYIIKEVTLMSSSLFLSIWHDKHCSNVADSYHINDSYHRVVKFQVILTFFYWLVGFNFFFKWTDVVHINQKEVKLVVLWRKDKFPSWYKFPCSHPSFWGLAEKIVKDTDTVHVKLPINKNCNPAMDDLIFST